MGRFVFDHCTTADSYMLGAPRKTVGRPLLVDRRRPMVAIDPVPLMRPSFADSPRQRLLIQSWATDRPKFLSLNRHP